MLSFVQQFSLCKKKEESKMRFVKRAACAVAFAACVAAVGDDAMSQAPSAVKLRVGTYNIRTMGADKGTPNAWEERKEDVVALIRKLNLDAFGLQEVTAGQKEFLLKALPEYDMVGEFRGAGKRRGEASSVCYLKSRFAVVKTGTFWLSETPEVPGSKSWNTAYPRVCTWVQLRDMKSGRTFCFANTHTDHKSGLARTEGMKLIVRRMSGFAPDGMPVVFTGDHNCSERSEAAKTVSAVLKDTFHATETPPVGPYRTYNGFTWRESPPATETLTLPPEKRSARGDYIYVSKDIRVKSYACHDEARPDTKLYPADHFPVTAEIELPLAATDKSSQTD